ncbi:hypothetical protein KQI41_00105 [Tissierella pigra]|uniref:ATP-binding protein n=1 Tax=Tissierella pigra TaxID=2607614 RepID=UPI001C11CB04|nr:AAA family ATPase [Tissierella pigra]MBU5424793.1 hypothetical protein [Tissierella pigra]
MSGVDNLQGIDYQVSYSVLILLELIQSELCSVDGIKFESLTEEEEDLNIYRCDGSKEFIQIKKKAEGYHWTPSEMKTIFEKFQAKDKENVYFKFVTNGGGNTTVAELKRKLLNGKALSDDLLDNFSSTNMSIVDLKSILKRTKILTLEYTSNDTNNPAYVVNERIKDILLSTTFQLTDTVENAFNSLWKYVFDLSKISKIVNMSDIITELSDIGICISNKIWFDLPVLKDFIGRENEIFDIKTALMENKRVIIKGISGTGKTMTLAKLADDLNSKGKNVAWLELNSTFSRNDILYYLASFFHDIGLQNLSKSLLKSEIRDIVPRILDAITKQEVYLIFDSLDKASVEVISIIEELFKESIMANLLGGIVISSLDSVECYSEVDIISNRVVEYKLFGLSPEDTALFFYENGIDISTDEIIDFHEAVGGHPISLAFLRQLVTSKTFNSEEIDKLSKLSIDSARKWLFNKVFLTLNQDEKDLLLNVSVFNYPFNENEVKQIIETKYKPIYLFDSLMKKCIVLSKRGLYNLHDAIRDMLYDMLDSDSKVHLHNKMAKYNKRIMENSYKDTGEVLYEDIFKWGYHLEQLEKGENLTNNCYELLQLDSEMLDALWAIERFGFPFSFADPELKYANNCVKFLLKKGLIKKNHNRLKRYLGTVKKFRLEGFDFFDSCFLHHLCITRGISNHLGYMRVFEPNEAFRVQGIICPWEHCIEYMPLPPITKAQHEARIKFLQEQFDNNAYDDKPLEIRERLWDELQEGVPEDAPELPDFKLEAASCPIFGHCCPDGEEQASFCRK